MLLVPGTTTPLFSKPQVKANLFWYIQGIANKHISTSHPFLGKIQAPHLHPGSRNSPWNFPFAVIGYSGTPASPLALAFSCLWVLILFRHALHFVPKFYKLVPVNFNLSQCLFVASTGIPGEVFHVLIDYLRVSLYF